ncbi:MAG: hypothetical protein GXO62_06445 [Epsilonproteobacteria bacterium]|nr:hypothetical protein [Campylobacterota bacterium]
MTKTFHLNVNELNNSFLEYIKTNFKNAQVDVIVKIDETHYLNASKTNKKRLEEAIKKVEKKEFINIPLEELE